MAFLCAHMSRVSTGTLNSISMFSVTYLADTLLPGINGDIVEPPHARLPQQPLQPFTAATSTSPLATGTLPIAIVAVIGAALFLPALRVCL